MGGVTSDMIRYEISHHPDQDETYSIELPADVRVVRVSRHISDGAWSIALANGDHEAVGRAKRPQAAASAALIALNMCAQGTEP